MKIPTWKVTVYLPIYRNGLGRSECIIIEAHTGPAAEEIALQDFPGSRVVSIIRTSGYQP